jgi:para-nitrobenzyl esterase
MRLAWLAILACIGCGDDNGTDPLVVQLDSGKVRGTTQGETRMFRGIPFAAPPVGENRWRSPQPVAPWTDVIDTIEVGSACPQAANPLGEQSDDEDCLYLNVWTPNDANNAPVMVWIHGGAFAIGTGGSDFYEGRHLAETQGVIVVTINYRLGPLGFFAHPELDGGNFGLEDQIASLEWVQRNIAAFGGDPGNVTIFGESAGGMSTCLLYVSPRTTGLFAAAISQSGLCSDETLLPTRARAETEAGKLATTVGCTDLACLRGKSQAELLEAASLGPVIEQAIGGLFFQPADVLPPLPFIDDDIITGRARDTFEAGNYEPRPLLLGSNKDEGKLFLIDLLGRPPTNETEYRDALARRYDATTVDAIVAMYPPTPTPDAALAELSTDAFFACPARRAARAAFDAGASVYLYSFERPLENPLVDGLGAPHAGEIPFVFGVDFLLGRVGAGQPTADAMQQFWGEFARSGSPGAEWPAYETAGDTLMVLENVPTTRAAHKAALCDFWDSL